MNHLTVEMINWFKLCCPLGLEISSKNTFNFFGRIQLGEIHIQKKITSADLLAKFPKILTKKGFTLAPKDSSAKLWMNVKLSSATQAVRSIIIGRCSASGRVGNSQLDEPTACLPLRNLTYTVAREVRPIRQQCRQWRQRVLYFC